MSGIYEQDVRTEFCYSYDVPIFIFQREHDWQTPTILVKPWFKKRSAPSKRYVPFEGSAYMVFTEELGKFIVQHVRPLALNSKC